VIVDLAAGQRVGRRRIRVGVEVRDGVAAGAEELAETDVAASGCESGLLRAAATPMPPVTTIAAAATTTVRARFMS
jgi:hypothetical protein